MLYNGEVKVVYFKIGNADQLLSSLPVEAMLEVKFVDDGLVDSSAEVEFVSSEDAVPGSGPKVHTHCLFRFLRPATGVSGHLSLSDSDDESRLSPARGERPFNRVRPNRCGNLSAGRSDKSVEGLELDSVDIDCELDWEREGSLDSDEVDEGSSVVVSSVETESVERVSVEEESGDSISECARVYLVFLISSTRGVRKETFFSAGNRGRPDILRESTLRIGLFANIECKLCDIEYGMVAEFVVEAEDTELELGVLDSKSWDSKPSVGWMVIGGW